MHSAGQERSPLSSPKRPTHTATQKQAIPLHETEAWFAQLRKRQYVIHYLWLLHDRNISAACFFFFFPEEELLLDEDELAFFLASCKSHSLDGLVTKAGSQQVT